MSFYDDLAAGKVKRSVLSLEKRFNPAKVLQSEHITSYIDEILYISKVTDKQNVLDFGCGNGAFSSYLAKHFKRVVGYDPSQEFIKQARVVNPDLFFTCDPLELNSQREFDAIIFIDALHHFDDESLDVVNDLSAKLNGPNGTVIIIEPNLLNPAMFLMHLLDKNERGLLRVGTISRYRKLFANYRETACGYSAIVIGPDYRPIVWLARLLDKIKTRFLRAILLPKVFYVATKID